MKNMIKKMIEAYEDMFPIGALSCLGLALYALFTDDTKVKMINTMFCLGYLIVVPIILAIIYYKLDKESD